MEYDFLGECTVVKGLLNLKVTITIFTVSTIGKQEILPSKYFFKYQYSMKYNQENILYGDSGKLKTGYCKAFTDWMSLFHCTC